MTESPSTPSTVLLSVINGDDDNDSDGCNLGRVNDGYGTGGSIDSGDVCDGEDVGNSDGKSCDSDDCSFTVGMARVFCRARADPRACDAADFGKGGFLMGVKVLFLRADRRVAEAVAFKRSLALYRPVSKRNTPKHSYQIFKLTCVERIKARASTRMVPKA